MCRAAGSRHRDGKSILIEMIVKKRCKRYGDELRQMRRHPDGVVVLLRAEPDRARADFLEQLEECRDARIAFGLQRAFGFEISAQGRVVRGSVGDQRVGRVAEEIGVGVRDAGVFASGHRMTRKKKRRIGAREKIGRSLRDA